MLYELTTVELHWLLALYKGTTVPVMQGGVVPKRLLSLGLVEERGSKLAGAGRALLDEWLSQRRQLFDNQSTLYLAL